MRERRLMILGSKEDFSNLTQVAVSKGIYTVVVDGNNGEAKKYASKSYTVDVNDDELIDLICKEERIDHVLSSFSDYLFEQMVYISNRNNLPCFCSKEKIKYLRDKMYMKEMFRLLDIPTNQAQVIDYNKVSLDYIMIPFPFIVKPSNGWGSKGVWIANNFNELKNILSNDMKSASSDSFMIESLNKGYEINIMSWIRDNEVFILEFGDRETSGANKHTIPYLSREIFPSFFYDELKNTIVEYLKKIAKFIGIKEGPLSMQLFYDENEIKVGEVAGRFFGLGQGIVPVINGIDLNELLINMIYFPENNTEILKNVRNNFNHYSVALYLKAKKGIVRDLGNVSKFNKGSHINEFKVFAEIGKSTSTIPWIARIYAHFNSKVEADMFTQKIYDELYIPNLDGENLVATNEIVEYRLKGESTSERDKIK